MEREGISQEGERMARGPLEGDVLPEHEHLSEELRKVKMFEESEELRIVKGL